MNSFGRPLKYGKAMKPLNLTIPEMYLDVIRDEAGELRVSVNEYANTIFATYDKELSKKATAEIKALREQLEKSTKELNALRSASKNYSSFIVEKVEHDESITPALLEAEKKFGDQYRRIVLSAGARDAEATFSDAFVFLENELAKANLLVKKPMLLKVQLKRRLLGASL